MSQQNRYYTSVFKRPDAGGPTKYLADTLPDWWSTKEAPTDPNISGKKILETFTPSELVQFKYFVQSFKKNKDIQEVDYFKKTAPVLTEQSRKILKCKLELIRRILKISITGAENLEDWCLLYIYYNNKFDFPLDIEELKNGKPHTSLGPIQLLSAVPNPMDTPQLLRATPGRFKNLSNIPMPGYNGPTEPRRDLFHRDTLPPLLAGDVSYYRIPSLEPIPIQSKRPYRTLNTLYG